MSDDTGAQNTEGGSPHRVRPRLLSMLDSALIRVRFTFSELGKEIRLFSRHLEHTVLPEEMSRREHEHVGSPGYFYPEQEVMQLDVDGEQLESFPSLSGFLSSLGIRAVVCDLELHSDQIEHVLRSLWMARHHLTDEQTDTGWDLLGRDQIARGLTGEQPMHVACTEPHLDLENGELRIANSYCTLTFSHAVNKFMERFSSFHDHRAFFRAAPRYGLGVAAVFLVPTVLSLAVGLSLAATVVVEAVMACIVGMSVFLLFQTVGAIQYDKEHQAKLLAEKHKELQDAHSHITQDMKRAARVQHGLIPESEEQPAPDSVRVAHSFVPQMEVGGDYYDYDTLEGGRLAFLFVDVSGHGMSGAFLTGVIKTIFEIAPTKDDPVAFMGLVNNMLIRITPPDSFAAIVYGVYDQETRTLTYVNAGHQPTPILLRAGDGSIEHPDRASGLAAGFVPDTPYEQTEVVLEPGDRLIMCTDGITERTNPDGEFFGVERLKRLLSETHSQPIDHLPNLILDRVAEHRGEAPQTDDETILAMEVVG